MEKGLICTPCSDFPPPWSLLPFLCWRYTTYPHNHVPSNPPNINSNKTVLPFVAPKVSLKNPSLPRPSIPVRPAEAKRTVSDTMVLCLASAFCPSRYPLVTEPSVWQPRPSETLSHRSFATLHHWTLKKRKTDLFNKAFQTLAFLYVYKLIYLNSFVQRPWVSWKALYKYVLLLSSLLNIGIWLPHSLFSYWPLCFSVETRNRLVFISGTRAACRVVVTTANKPDMRNVSWS